MLDLINVLYILLICYLMLSVCCLLKAICEKLNIKDDEWEPMLMLKKARKLRKEKKNEKKD